MKPNDTHRKIGLCTAALLLCLTGLTNFSSCSEALDDYLLPGEATLPEINSDLLHVDTADPSPDAADTEADAPRYPFDHTQIHQGIGIAYKAPEESIYKDICVVIDAGHQARANNATEPIAPDAEETAPMMSAGHSGRFTGQAEHDLNLAVALSLRNELCARGYSVLMVRECADVNISERERAELANDAAEDFDHTVYIRIHAEVSDSPEERGALVLCASEDNATAAVAAQAEESRLLGDYILERYCTDTPNVRPHAPTVLEDDTLTAANHCRVPTVAVVLGFLSHEVEDVSMSYNEFRTAAGESIAAGVNAYFRHLLDLDDDLPVTFEVTEAPVEPETEPTSESTPESTPETAPETAPETDPESEPAPESGILLAPRPESDADAESVPMDEPASEGELLRRRIRSDILF